MVTKTWTLTFPEEKIQLFAQKLWWTPTIPQQDGVNVVFVDNPILPEDVCIEAITNNMIDFIKWHVGYESINNAVNQARIDSETQIKQSILAGIAVE